MEVLSITSFPASLSRVEIADPLPEGKERLVKEQEVREREVEEVEEMSGEEMVRIESEESGLIRMDVRVSVDERAKKRGHERTEEEEREKVMEEKEASDLITRNSPRSSSIHSTDFVTDVPSNGATVIFTSLFSSSSSDPNVTASLSLI